MISELNFPSANGFQSPKCYQDNSSNQNTNYLWGTTVNSEHLPTLHANLNDNNLNDNCVNSRNYLTITGVNGTIVRKNVTGGSNKTEQKEEETDIKKFSLVIHECQARASHSLGNITFSLTSCPGYQL